MKSEEREIDAAVLAVLQKMGVLGEIVVLAVFEDKDAIGFEQSAIEDEVGQRGEFLEGVGRIGKNEVELLMAGLDESEDISAECYHIGDSPPVIRFATHRGDSPLCGGEFFQTVLDEAVVVAVEFYADDAAAATRQKFKGNAARAGE